MVKINGVYNAIVQGLYIDAESDGASGTHTRNVVGISLTDATNSTVHQCHVKNAIYNGTRPNLGIGILTQGNSTYNLISSCSAEGSDYGNSFSNSASTRYNTLQG